MEKRRKKGRNLKTAVIKAILMYVFLVLALLMTAVHLPNTYMPNIIGISLCWSIAFWLYLYCIIKESELKKRKILIYMSIELILMLCLNIYSYFSTQENQRSILEILTIGGFAFLLALTFLAEHMRNVKK